MLLHHVPPAPAYFRARVLRRLSQLGALPLKRSAYILPASESTLEDLQWLRQEIASDGGDAWVLESRFAGGLTDDDVRNKFREMRTTDYRAIAGDARGLLEGARRVPASQEAGDDRSAELRKLQRRLEATRRIDFFDAEGRDEADALVAALERQLSHSSPTDESSAATPALTARTWATRAGVKVDRMASAWLIRRFIDPAATFVFVESGEPLPQDAVRFDMFQGEFTHDSGRCTFEVLLAASSRATDRALIAIGEIVHDIDLRDDRYQRPETPGVAAMVDGIAARFEADQQRLAESAPLWDALYATLGRKQRRAAQKKRTT